MEEKTKRKRKKTERKKEINKGERKRVRKREVGWWCGVAKPTAACLAGSHRR